MLLSNLPTLYIKVHDNVLYTVFRRSHWKYCVKKSVLHCNFLTKNYNLQEEQENQQVLSLRTELKKTFHLVLDSQKLLSFKTYRHSDAFMVSSLIVFVKKERRSLFKTDIPKKHNTKFQNDVFLLKPVIYHIERAEVRKPKVVFIEV